MKHVLGPICGSCSEKLEDVHPDLLFWFLWVKELHEDAHVSWGFRDEKSQDEAFLKGLSKAQWPNSKHNNLDSDGRPLSLAVDIFQITEDGKGHWDRPWFEQIWHETLEKNCWQIAYGGDFKTQKGDFNHFELKENV